MDLARAEAQLDALVERRAQQAAVEDLWEASAKREEARRRREVRAAWFCHWSALADSLRRSADHYERRALELLEDEPERSKR